MSISISGSNAISGLGGNDTNFDKVLEQLKKIESSQLNRLESWKSDWNLRYEAFTQIIDQVKAASSMLSQLSDKNSFVTKNVQTSNENIITAVANASAQDIQHTIKVSQVASNAIWANSHVYESKNQVINTTGKDQYFSYTYAGKRHDFKVPPNTTLDSFVSMVNNSADNKGIKISLIQTGKGYVFQVAGKETGAANDLLIHDSNLVGMEAKGTETSWITNSSLNILNKDGSPNQITNPTNYVFDIVLQGGAKKSVTVKGNATAEELVTALNNAASGINASVDAFGNLTLQGVQSFSRREEGQKPYTPASTRVSLAGDIKDSNGNYVQLNATGGIADGMPDDELLRFTLTMDDGTTREMEIKAGATKRDLLVALAQATQSGDSVNIGLESDGWGTTLPGVTDVSVAAVKPANSGYVDASKMGLKKTEASGVKDTLGGALASADLTLTFDKDKLSKRVDGKESGDSNDLVFTIIKQDGTAINITGIKSDMTNQQMLDHLNAELANQGFTVTLGTDANGNSTLLVNGAKSFGLSGGAAAPDGFTTSLAATTTITATNGNTGPTSSGDLFHFDAASGKYLLEKAPDLVYTVTTNDGKKGVLTLNSGESMADIMKALKDPDDSRWVWTEKDASGNEVATTRPALYEVKFTDETGKEYVDASGNPILDPEAIDGPVYLTFKNVQTATGPGDIDGQVYQSSNWNIQRAANARYQVDNWPVEMESATNSITDVIEGVVFDLQDVGEARISVSTDITSVEQSIQNFLDAVNSVLLTVNDLMKFDEHKEVTSNDPDDIGNDNYSQSGLTNQKGGLLMGNYGVQLFKSRFTSLVTATPPGFKSRQSADDILSGDVLASLSQLGIKTDTDTTSDTYGLLVLAPSSGIAELQSMDKERYNDYITNNLEAVVDFFCSSGSGSTTSTDFRYGSHVEGITKAGNYEVKYTVNPDGTISNVTIGGEPATRDESQPGNYFSVAKGDPRGLSILIDDLTVGDHPPAGGEPMYVRIKEGLVQTVNNFFKDELVFNDVNISANSTPSQIADAVALKSKNGALMSLRDNYMTVMEGIDAKIEREQRRISTWEARQKKIFANLETLLKQYDEQQKSLESQLKQLSGNS